MDISFVIPMIGDYPQIIMTINSIQAEMEKSPLTYEIIFVENAKTDPYTENFKKAYRVPISKQRIRYLFEERQCGPAARMKGASEAKGKYTLFMDSHTILSRDSVDTMVETFENVDAGIVHGATVKTHVVPPHVRGLHYRLFGNAAQNLNRTFHGAYSRAGQDNPYPLVGANLAYTLFNTRELLDLRGYHPECMFYPHPEGYLPLKYLMFGRQPWGDPRAFHFHSIYRNKGAQGKGVWEITIRDDPYKLVGQDHHICNAMICAYTLGGEKWLEILYDTWSKTIRSKYILKGIRDHARKVSEQEHNWVQNNAEYTLDEVLTEARRQRVDGMENWYHRIGVDPLGR